MIGASDGRAADGRKGGKGESARLFLVRPSNRGRQHEGARLRRSFIGMREFQIVAVFATSVTWM